MVEYLESGEPIPDGRVTIEIGLELAYVWDPGNRHFMNYTPPHEPKQSYVFWFKDLDRLQETQNYFCIIFPNDKGDRANTRMQIPWGQILSIQLNKNSDEFVAAARAYHGNLPEEFFDTRYGGTCIACASRSRVRG